MNKQCRLKAELLGAVRFGSTLLANGLMKYYLTWISLKKEDLPQILGVQILWMNMVIVLSGFKVFNFEHVDVFHCF